MKGSIKVVEIEGKHYNDCIWCDQAIGTHKQKIGIICCKGGNIKICEKCFKSFVLKVRLNLDSSIAAFT